MTGSRWAALLIAVATAGVLCACTGVHQNSRAHSSSTVGPTQTILSTGKGASLAVHIGLFGGPLKPDGTPALSNSPQADATVIAIDRDGHRRSALTGRDGVATFSVPEGQYTVSSSFCGAPHHVAVKAGERAHVEIVCPVP
jgi:hypothetical protein